MTEDAFGRTDSQGVFVCILRSVRRDVRAVPYSMSLRARQVVEETNWHERLTSVPGSKNTFGEDLYVAICP